MKQNSLVTVFAVLGSLTLAGSEFAPDGIPFVVAHVCRRWANPRP